MIKERINGLNRRVFKRNLKKVLNPSIIGSVEGSGLENWVEDYRQQLAEGCTSAGWYEIKRHEHKHGRAEQIRTN